MKFQMRCEWKFIATKLTNAICEFYVDFCVCVCGKFILLTCRKETTALQKLPIAFEKS